MNASSLFTRRKALTIALLCSALATGCDGGDRDRILGSDGPGAGAPRVVTVTPAADATNVATVAPDVTATFNEPVSLSAATFTLACAAPCTSATGTTTSDAADGAIARYTLTPGTALDRSTRYTATIGGVTSTANGTAMTAPFVWSFTTGSGVAAGADVTRPRVTVTDPATTSPGPTLGFPLNAAIGAVFNEEMAAASLTQATFTLACAAPCVAPAGTVRYASGSRTATFSPDAVLLIDTTYTATITAGATDVAGNALAGNQAPLPGSSSYVWSFTTSAATVPAPVTVGSTNPLDAATGVCPAATIAATFDVPSGRRLDPATVNATTFTVTGPAPAATPVVATTIALDDATGRVATFTPSAALTAGTTYTATLVGGVSGIADLANPANRLAQNFTWTFTAGPAGGQCLAPVNLRSIASFGTFGGSAGMTNQGLQTIINGDIGTTAVSTSVTGFHDAGPGCTYTETVLNVGLVNGLIYTAAPPPTVACPSEGTAQTFAIASQARADGLAAYNALVALPPGSDPGAGSLANLVLAPGVYTAASGSFMIQGGPLTLDAQGNPNAVWVFQMATSLTVGGPGAAFPQSVVLVNGAEARNVFWQVGSAATINAAGGGQMVGTIIAQEGAAFSTPGNTTVLRLDGRVLSLGASVTLVDTVINVPAP